MHAEGVGTSLLKRVEWRALAEQVPSCKAQYIMIAVSAAGSTSSDARGGEEPANAGE